LAKEKSFEELELPALFDTDEPLFITPPGPIEPAIAARIEIIRLGGTGGDGGDGAEGSDGSDGSDGGGGGGGDGDGDGIRRI
jgi:hypothetical protein